MFYCKHECDVNCDDKCDHNCYDDSCYLEQFEQQQHIKDLTKEEVLEVREERLKYLKEFTLNRKHVISKGELQVT